MVVVGLGRSKENRGSAAGFSLDYYLAYKIVKRDVYLTAARLLLVMINSLISKYWTCGSTIRYVILSVLSLFGMTFKK